LLSVHSRCGLHTRTVTYVTVIRGLQTLRHLHACPGCFRLEQLPGGIFTHRKAPPLHGARQIQALDRTQPGLPMKKGRAGTMTHDYKRHGTTTLFAALNVATGRVIGECMKRHRHQEWLKFLRLIDRSTPKGFDLHLIADNYATHKHPAVKAWLAKHPRFHMHFTPTSASWLNQVERFFGFITGDRIRCGVFKSVAELEGAIQDYLDHHNADPKPFVWTKSATDILEKVAKGRQALESQH
jgi:hypothetical protein